MIGFQRNQQDHASFNEENEGKVNTNTKMKNINYVHAVELESTTSQLNLNELINHNILVKYSQTKF